LTSPQFTRFIGWFARYKVSQINFSVHVYTETDVGYSG